MRIIAGLARGRSIAAPPAGTRPTSDRVRESLFAMLDARIDIEGLDVLDLYAGSGALGLEALSRGARHATLVESDARAAATIASNAALCGFATSTVDVRRRRVESVVSVRPSDPVDLVFLDPPYAVTDDVVSAHLADLVANDWCSPGAVVVVERSSRSPETVWPSGMGAEVSRRYGETRLDLGVTPG